MPVTATSGQLLEEIHRAIATLPVENKAQLNTLHTYGLVPEWLVALHHPDVLSKEKRDLTPFQPNEDPLTEEELDLVYGLFKAASPNDVERYFDVLTLPPDGAERPAGIYFRVRWRPKQSDFFEDGFLGLVSLPRAKASVLRFAYNVAKNYRPELWPDIFQSPWCPPDILADFVARKLHLIPPSRYDKVKLGDMIATHPNTPRETLGVLLSGKLPLAGLAGLALLKHPDATLEEEQRAAALVLAYSAKEELVALLATAQTDNVHLLHELSLEGHWSWRLGVALNRHTPPELLASLAHDDAPLVRAIAQARLQGEDLTFPPPGGG